MRSEGRRQLGNRAEQGHGLGAAIVSEQAALHGLTVERIGPAVCACARTRRARASSGGAVALVMPPECEPASIVSPNGVPGSMRTSSAAIQP